MDFTINAILFEEEEFEINKDLLRKDFNSEENKNKKEWFFKTYDSDERAAIRTQWYNQMKELRKNICFFDRYKTYYVETLKFMLEHLPIEDHLTVIKKLTNTWKLPNKTEEIESVHPPLEQIKIREVKATPLKNIESTNDIIRQAHIAQLMEQNNFTNINLQTIGKQTDRIENLIHDLKPSRAKTHLDKSPAIILPHYMNEGISLGNKDPIQMNDIDEFTQELSLRLQRLSLENTINTINASDSSTGEEMLPGGSRGAVMAQNAKQASAVAGRHRRRQSPRGARNAEKVVKNRNKVLVSMAYMSRS